jgi:hypothetical protein
MILVLRDFSPFFGGSMAQILWSSVMQDLVVLSLHGMATVDYTAASLSSWMVLTDQLSCLD